MGEFGRQRAANIRDEISDIAETGGLPLGSLAISAARNELSSKLERPNSFEIIIDKELLASDKITEREMGVVQCVMRGLSNTQIARELVVTPETVKSHMRHLLEKTGSKSRTELIISLLKAGLIKTRPL